MRHRGQAGGIHHLHGVRALLIAVLIFAFFLVNASVPMTAAQNTDNAVLAYATSISRDSLLSATNGARIDTGHSSLRMNEKLNASAQAKAEAMVKENYWSHESPRGEQPWLFFEQQGYSYEKAGENLAYGFDNSDAAVAAWMNSPSHRDNLLGSYDEVGFGIANGSHYQGGPYTIVVAHYGTPQKVVAGTADTGVDLSNFIPVATGTTASITTGQQLLSGHLPLIAIVSLSLCAGAGLMFAATHRRLFAHAVANGEEYALSHPLIDASVLAVITTLILFSTRGAVS